MLLTGSFERSLDDKLRLSIPKGLRDEISRSASKQKMGGGDPNDEGSESITALYVAPGTDGSLMLYPEVAFERLASQLETVSPNGRDVRAFSRVFFSQAQRCELDRQGRVRIPPELAKLASLVKETVLLGVRDHMELWDRERWLNYLGQKQMDYDAIAENALDPNSQTTLNRGVSEPQRVTRTLETADDETNQGPPVLPR
jgi:MraZ protein